MNKDQVKGAAKDFGGKIQEEVGKLTGSKEQQAKGLKNQAEGKVQEHFGDLKENVKDASRKSRHVPSYYGKVLFLTKDQTRLKWVKDDGSLGSDVDLDDLTELREYLRSSIPQQT